MVVDVCVVVVARVRAAPHIPVGGVVVPNALDVGHSARAAPA